ncbi:hypothetical protein [Clostridium sp. C8-1-8]|uniref:hypothetical protein n=1 Tax=Clostridium sp. C8-1-8 TaxID=2698831 RepID=UPI00136C19A3|nr:hypothetical protein [Clostridium sp. C8-1-8]
MNKNLWRGIIFKIDEKKRIGTMRIDFCGSDGGLCNQWNPTKLLTHITNNSKIYLCKLQQEINYIQFELLSNFERIEQYCNGNGYDKETLFSISLDYADYAIKLIPVRDSYSYIYTYMK